MLRLESALLEVAGHAGEDRREQHGRPVLQRGERPEHVRCATRAQLLRIRHNGLHELLEARVAKEPVTVGALDLVDHGEPVQRGDDVDNVEGIEVLLRQGQNFFRRLRVCCLHADSCLHGIADPALLLGGALIARGCGGIRNRTDWRYTSHLIHRRFSSWWRLTLRQRGQYQRADSTCRAFTGSGEESLWDSSEPKSPAQGRVLQK